MPKQQNIPSLAELSCASLSSWVKTLAAAWGGIDSLLLHSLPAPSVFSSKQALEGLLQLDKNECVLLCMFKSYSSWWACLLLIQFSSCSLEKGGLPSKSVGHTSAPQSEQLFWGSLSLFFPCIWWKCSISSSPLLVFKLTQFKDKYNSKIGILINLGCSGLFYGALKRRGFVSVLVVSIGLARFRSTQMLLLIVHLSRSSLIYLYSLCASF